MPFAAPPQYSLDSDYLEAEAGSTSRVAFHVTSDPPLAEDAEHTLSKVGGGEVTKRFKVDGNSITFRSVRLEDSGMYTISCRNDEGEVGQATLELEVVPPRTASSSHGSNIGKASYSYESLHITVCVCMLPDYLGLKGPDIEHLHFIKNRMTGASFRLMERIATKWKTIGFVLAMEYDQLQSLEEEKQTNYERLTAVFAKWCVNASQMPNGHHYPHSWEGLRAILGDAELKEIATQYFDFLSSLHN